MFSATVKVGASWNSWKMIATPRSRAAIGLRALFDTPSTMISPLSGV